MAFNINDMIAQINGVNGVLRRDHYDVLITNPPALNGGTDGQFMSFAILETALPGVGFDVEAIKRHGYGLVERRPTDVTFAQINMNCIMDAKGKTVKFFEDWMTKISPYQNLDGDTQYLFQYPTTYETSINITVYDVAGKKVLKYTLYNAFPTEKGEQAVYWSAENEYLILPITMSYRNYKIEINPTS